MKKLSIFLAAGLLTGSLIWIGCEKIGEITVDNGTVNVNGELRVADAASIMGVINGNNKKFKTYLDLISKSLVKLMDDSVFTKIVAEEAEANFDDKLSVKFSDLIVLCNSKGHDLLGKMDESLDFCNVLSDEKSEVFSIIESFEIGGFTFEPKINLVALHEKYVKDNWDGQTPCFVATSLFYLPAAKIPTYRIENGELVEEKITYTDIINRPTWHVSFAHNVPYLDENGEVVEVIEHAFAQETACDCYDSNDDPPAKFCCFVRETGPGGSCPDVTGSNGLCSGSCDPAIPAPDPIVLVSCTSPR